MRTPLEWDQVFMKMAYNIAERSKDDSTQVGAVLISQKNIILACGFNGPPPQLHDEEVPWNIRPDKYNYIIHAEENALLFALGSHGSYPIAQSIMYCTHEPCPSCILRMIRMNVSEVVYPITALDYPLKRFECNIEEIIEKQKFPKIQIRKITV